MTDGNGLPLAVTLSAGQRHESVFFEPVMEAALQARPNGPQALAADKGYSAKRIRRWLAERRIRTVIPHRRNERHLPDEPPFDAVAYRRRNVVERAVGWLKLARHIATRADKLAQSFLAFLKLAFIRRYLQALHLRDTA